MRNKCFGSSIVSSLGCLALALVLAGGCAQEAAPVEYVVQKTWALGSSITIHGVVTDGAGHPQAGVVVAFLPTGAGQPDAGGAPPPTGADGTYSVDIAAGTYDVVATPPPTSIYIPQPFAGRVFSNSSVFDIVLLQGGVTVSGRVTTSDGTPLSGQVLSFSGNNATTDSAGNYSVAVVPGDILVNALVGMNQITTGLTWAVGGDGGVPGGVGPIYSHISGGLSRLVSISGATTVDVVLPTRVISGVVLDPDGHPVAGTAVGTGNGPPGWTVQTSGADGGASGDAGTGPWSISMYAADTSCDGNGNFRLTVVPGSGTLNITPPAGSGLPAYQVNVQATQDTTITINLPRAVTVSGKVTTSDGTPLLGQSVSLPGSNGQTDSAGNYSMAVVPGDVSLSVSPGMNEPQFATGLSSAGGTGGSGGSGAPDGGAAIYSYLTYSMSRSVSISGPTIVDAVLPTRVISGVVLDPDGHPVGRSRLATTRPPRWTVQTSGADVGASGDAGTGPWSISMNAANTSCDGNGNFRLTVVPGSGTLDITPPAGSGLPAYQVNVQATQDTTITINLPRAVTVSGKVTTSDGTPLVGEIHIAGSNSVTDNAGNYSLAIPPGDSSLTVSTNSAEIATGLISAEGAGGSGYDGGASGGGAAIYSALWYWMSRLVSISESTTLDVVLPTRVISGVVLDPDGHPVGGSSLATASPNGWTVGAGGAGAEADGGPGAWLIWMYGAGTTSDGAGNFRLTVVPGSGTLGIRPPPSSGLLAYSFPVQALEDKQIGISIQFVTQSQQATVQANGTLTTDPGAGPTPADPVTTTVTSPSAGDVSITERPIIQSPPSGYSFLTQQIDITAPAATAAQPLVLTFMLDASRVPPGLSASDLQITRDGDIVRACADRSGTANPDPCVSNRETTADGDIRITVLTSHASAWNFAVPTIDNGTGGSGGSGGSTGGGTAGAPEAGGAGGATNSAGTTAAPESDNPGDTTGGVVPGLGFGGVDGTTSIAGTAGASGSGGIVGTGGAPVSAGTGAPGPGETGGAAGINGGAGTPGTAGTADAASASDSAALMGQDGSVAYSPSEPDAGSYGSMPEVSDAQGAEIRNSVDSRETRDGSVDLVPASDTTAAESIIDSGVIAVDAASPGGDGAPGSASADKGSGCSCAMAGKDHSSALALFWGFAALLLARRVRRRVR